MKPGVKEASESVVQAGSRRILAERREPQRGSGTKKEEKAGTEEQRSRTCNHPDPEMKRARESGGGATARCTNRLHTATCKSQTKRTTAVNNTTRTVHVLTPEPPQSGGEIKTKNRKRANSIAGKGDITGAPRNETKSRRKKADSNEKRQECRAKTPTPKSTTPLDKEGPGSHHNGSEAVTHQQNRNRATLGKPEQHQIPPPSNDDMHHARRRGKLQHAPDAPLTSSRRLDARETPRSPDPKADRRRGHRSGRRTSRQGHVTSTTSQRYVKVEHTAIGSALPRLTQYMRRPRHPRCGGAHGIGQLRMTRKKVAGGGNEAERLPQTNEGTVNSAMRRTARAPERPDTGGDGNITKKRQGDTSRVTCR